MSFEKKFGIVAPIILALPFFFILATLYSGTGTCLDNVQKNLPSAVQGNKGVMDSSIEEYCNPDTGEFLFVKKLGDVIRDFYKAYFFVGVVLSLILTWIWDNFF